MSLADWDFHDWLNHGLDNAVYVSSPSSLRCYAAVTGEVRIGAACRSSDTLNLPEGRIETQWRHTDFTSSPKYPLVFFRMQSALGALDRDNQYVVRINNTQAIAEKCVGGSWSTLGTWSRSHNVDTWYRERITWWKEGDSLAIRYEYWDGSQWVIVGSDIYDNSPSFEGSTQNRCGVGQYSNTASADYSHFDDTIIEGP